MNNKDWWFEKINGISLIRFSHFEKHSNFKYFVTTRNSGLSTGQVSSFNLGYMDLDSSENVFENRKILAKAMEIPLNSFVFTRQTHSDNIMKVETRDKQSGLYSKENAIEDNDGFIVSETGICPVVMTADCVPVILFDPVNKVAGVFHAGWRGTVKLIVQKGLLKMVNEFGTDPSEVLASVGPSIGPCCYEVGDEVILEVKNVFPENNNELLRCNDNGKSHFDLWKTNKIQLIMAGVKEKNIIICDTCTYHNPDILFSWRYSAGKTGRMAAGVFLLNS